MIESTFSRLKVKAQMMKEMYCDSDKVTANQKCEINKHILVTEKKTVDNAEKYENLNG